MSKRLASLIAFIVLLPASSAWSCTVCFGGADSNLARGFYWGIILLGVLPFVLLACLITAIVVASRKSRRHALSH